MTTIKQEEYKLSETHMWRWTKEDALQYKIGKLRKEIENSPLVLDSKRKELSILESELELLERHK